MEFLVQTEQSDYVIRWCSRCFGSKQPMIIFAYPDICGETKHPSGSRASCREFVVQQSRTEDHLQNGAKHMGYHQRISASDDDVPDQTLGCGAKNNQQPKI